MTTADRPGGAMKLDDIRAELEAEDRTFTQRKQAFEHLRRWLRKRPDDEEATTLWARFEDEFGRHHADAPIARESSGEGFGALSEAEERAVKKT